MACRDDDDFLEEEWVPARDDDDPADWDDEGADEDDLIDCPACGQEIHIESEQCPHCGLFIPDHRETPSSLWQGRPWWWVALGILGIIAVVVALSRPW